MADPGYIPEIREGGVQQLLCLGPGTAKGPEGQVCVRGDVQADEAAAILRQKLIFQRADAKQQTAGLPSGPEIPVEAIAAEAVPVFPDETGEGRHGGDIDLFGNTQLPVPVPGGAGSF